MSQILSPHNSQRPTHSLTPPKQTPQKPIHHSDTYNQENITPAISFETPNHSLNSSSLSSCSSSSKANNSSFNSSHNSSRSTRHSQRLLNHPVIREAKHLLTQKKYHSVIDVLDATLRDSHESRYALAESAYLTGIAYRSLEKFQKAKEYLVLARKYKHQRACNALGVVCQQEGDRDEALRWYREAQQQAPNDASAFYNAGLILFEKCKVMRRNKANEQLKSQQDLQKTKAAAQKMFEKASRRGHVLAYFQLGSLALLDKAHDNAFRYFSKGARKGDASCIVSLAELYLSGHVSQSESPREEARKLLHEASVRHGHQGARLLLAKMAFEDEKYALATEYFQLVEHYAEAKFYLGIMLFEGKGCEVDLNRAKVLLEQVLETFPNSAYHLAKIYLSEGNAERAEHYYEMLLRVGASDVDEGKILEAREYLEGGSIEGIIVEEVPVKEAAVVTEVIALEVTEEITKDEAVPEAVEEQQDAPAVVETVAEAVAEEALPLPVPLPLEDEEIPLETENTAKETPLPEVETKDMVQHESTHDTPQIQTTNTTPTSSTKSGILLFATGALTAGLVGFLFYWQRMRVNKTPSAQ